MAIGNHTTKSSTYQWWILHCHVWVSEGLGGFCYKPQLVQKRSAPCYSSELSKPLAAWDELPDNRFAGWHLTLGQGYMHLFLTYLNNVYQLNCAGYCVKFKWNLPPGNQTLQRKIHHLKITFPFSCQLRGGFPLLWFHNIPGLITGGSCLWFFTACMFWGGSTSAWTAGPCTVSTATFHLGRPESEMLVVDGTRNTWRI